MYKEFQKTGKVVKTLPDDDKLIRKLHASQVLRVPLKQLDKQEIGPIGTAHVPPEGEAVPEVEEVAEEDLELTAADLAELEEIELDEVGDIVTAAPAEENEAPLTDVELSAGDEDEDDEEDEEDEDLEDDEDEDESDDEDEYEDDEDEDYDEDDDEEEYDEEEYDESEDYEDEEDYDQSEYEDEDEAEEYDDTVAEPSEDSGEPAEAPHVRTSSLTRESPVVDAPSIGPKTAARLEAVDIFTIGDLLDCDIEETAFLLDVHYIDSETIRDWQDQTKLMMDVPGLRVHDVQIMVGAGIRTKKELAEAPARTLFLLATEFLGTPEGERVRRGDDLFMEEEVEEWIERAQEAA